MQQLTVDLSSVDAQGRNFSYWIFLMTNGSRNTFEVELTLLILILHQLPMPDETLPQTVAYDNQTQPLNGPGANLEDDAQPSSYGGERYHFW